MSDEVLLEQVRSYVLPTMQKQGPVVAWIVDDTLSIIGGCYRLPVSSRITGEFINLTHTPFASAGFGVIPLSGYAQLLVADRAWLFYDPAVL